MISNKDNPNILSLFGGIIVLLTFLFLFFNLLSSLILEILRVNPKNTISIGFTAEPIGLFSMKKHISLIKNGKAATATV